MKKYGLEVERIKERGFLLCKERPSVELLKRFENYLYEIVEISEEEARKLTSENEREAKKEVTPGSFVEINSGLFQDFKGILRALKGEIAIVDINIFGKVSTVEVLKSELSPLSIPEWV
jgi:transcription antitermination factor NusG